MGKKNPNNEKLKKVYREYARIKFKKYKLQFPRLREQEIVNKILRQWESLNEEGKNNIQKEFLARGGSAFLQASSSSSSKKKREAARKKKAEAIANSKTGKKKDGQKKSSPKVRTFEEKYSSSRVMRKKSSDYARSDQGKPGKVSTPDKNKSSSSNLLENAKKTKRIAKLAKDEKRERKKSQALEFKKYYYHKLAAEHPKWEKPQIETIVKLLWQRKKRGKKTISGIPRKGLSGRQLYRRTKQSEGLLKQQINQMWKGLPHESKRYWQIKGKGTIHKSARTTGKYVRKVLNSGAITDEGNNSSKPSFSWMEHQIS